MYLVGDSNAGMYADGLVVATEQTRRVCQDGTCGTVSEDGFTYRDGKHISRSFSEQLAPWLREGLETSSG